MHLDEPKPTHDLPEVAAIVANIPGVVFRLFARPDGTRGFSFMGERAQEVIGIDALPYESCFQRFQERIAPSGWDTTS